MEGFQEHLVSRRLRGAVIIIDIIIMISGLCMTALGGLITTHLAGPDIRPLWTVGFLPTSLGVLSLGSVLSRNSKVILVVLVVSMVIVGVSFSLLTMCDCLDPQVYGVSIQIFSQCITHAGMCTCQWNDGQGSGYFPRRSCESILYVSTLFLIVLAMLTLSLVLFLTSLTLTFCLTFCLHRCIAKNELHNAMSTCATNSYVLIDRQELYTTTNIDQT